MALPLLVRQFRTSIFRRSVVLPKRLYSGYVVLLPEIGEDLPDKNPFVRADGIPDFKNVTIENCLAKIGRQSTEVEKAVKDAEQYLTTNGPLTLNGFFENVLNPVEQAESQLEISWGLAKTLYLSNTSLMPAKKYVVMHQRANRAHTAKYNSFEIYKAACELKNKCSDNNQLTPEQETLLNRFILEGKLNGIGLENRKKELLNYNLIKLSDEKITYQTKVNIAIDRFSHTITDYTEVRLFPNELLKAMSKDPKNHLLGPWRVSLEPHIYNTFMEYCPDRMLRWNLWQANTRKASKVTVSELDNGMPILKIRDFRKEVANLLGYKNYVEMSMETKMVGSLQNAQEFIQGLLADARPAQENELKRLSDFAYKNGFSSRILDEHDVPYWRRKYAIAVCRYDKNLIQEYFPLTKVLNGLFDLCEKLFNIKVVEQVDNISTWNKNVRYFEIFDLSKSSLGTNSGKPIAGLYLDLFSQSHEHSGGFTVTIRDKCSLINSSPLASIILNLPTPLYGKPSLLSLNEARTLFSKFGHTLRLLLTEVNYSELAGHKNIEWDAVEVCEDLFNNLFYDSDILKSLSEHVSTKECLSDSLIQTIQAERLNLAGYDLCNELFISTLDLELHSTDEFWLDIVRRIWPQYYIFPLDKNDARVCSMVDIFATDWSAGYFSHLWAEMLAADIYQAFSDTKKADNSTEALKEVGQRFRKTFLAQGGSRPMSDIFRSFQGRDPSPQALTTLLSIKQPETIADPSKTAEIDK